MPPCPTRPRFGLAVWAAPEAPAAPAGWVGVEVKTRSGLAFGDPFESIDRRKLTRLHRLTAAWVRAHAADRRGTPWRVDAVAVLVPRTGGIRFDLLQDVRP